MTAHPLDPLSADEITAAANIVHAEAGLDETAWFETITLDEPTREESASDTRPTRRAYVCCFERSSNRTMSGIVDLDAGQLSSWNHVPGAQARITPDEFMEGDRIAKASAEFCAALERRGITDLEKVLVETWAAGNFGYPEEEGRRLAYTHAWQINEAGDNRYGRPIANLHALIDLVAGEVLRVDDFGVVPLPPDSAAIRPDEGLRADLKPLEITQPEGPSFTVDGQRIDWQKWQVRVGFNLREGLVLHDIGYHDQGRLRPIMRRASMAEMVVPYGDPTNGNYRRNAFDTGEYGLGAVLDSLKLGCDCLGHIHYLDVAAHDWAGKPYVIENAVCLHEEDFGLLWKHTDGRTGASRAVRSRRLVISTIATIGNYVYGFFWYFYQDGTIGAEIKATGIPFPSGIAPGEKPVHGALVAPGIESHVHQHSFSFRFEMCVDGPSNSVQELEFEPLPMGPENPHGNGVRIIDRQLASETEAVRQLDTARARSWKVVNADRLNGLGEPVAYRLAPGVNTVPTLHPDSPVGQRAGFMFNHFWATQYDPQQLYPAGWFPNQSAGGDGLPDWVKADRSLDQQDVVVWYTLNFHHLPRPEDWPVQPVVYAGMHWMPEGFFDQNPALDVPPGSGG
ncbi:MAG: primary-amine oxidase [Pseudomonadota bacterium]